MIQRVNVSGYDYANEEPGTPGPQYSKRLP